MIVLQMKPNQNLAAMFRSFFSIGVPISSHLGILLDISGTNQLFIWSNVFVLIIF